MRKITKKTILLLTVLAITLLALFAYGVILPEYNASRYVNRVHQAANRLRTDYQRLEQSTEQTLINDPDISSDNLVEEVESLRNLLRENRINLAHFTTATKDYDRLPYTGFTNQAKEAVILQSKAAAFAEQSDEAFTQYGQLIDFIKRYGMTAKMIEEYTQEFNSTSDLNVLAGQHDQLYIIAAQIRTNAQQLDTAETPHEAMAFKSASVKSFQQLANGFETVALGLQIPADDIIYDGARKIEATDQEIAVTNQAIYEKDILSSRTIKSIQELREKLDLIMP